MKRFFSVVRVFCKTFCKALLLVLLLSSCSSWKLENLSGYKTSVYGSFTVYTVGETDSGETDYDFLRDIEKVEKNLRGYLENKLNLPLNKENLKLAVIPFINDIIDFEKQKSTATSSPSRKIIILADFNNIPQNLHELYGDPPDDIFITSFEHELTHCLTLWQNKFGFNGFMKEILAVFISYIDFRNDNYDCFKTNSDLPDDIKDCYTDERIKILASSNLERMETVKTREAAVFMTYLHLSGKYDYIKEMLFARNMKDFLSKVNWTASDTEDFINWIKITASGI